MMSKAVFALLGLVLSLYVNYAQDPGNKIELSIKEVERELEGALAKGDTNTIDRLLADDYLEIDARGRIKKKADLLAAARAVAARPPSVMVGPDKTVDELAIRVHGDCALVSGRTTIRYQFMEYQTATPQPPSQSPVSIDQERFIRTYSKAAGRWRLVAWQTTSIPKG